MYREKEENSGTSDSHGLLLNLTDNINLKKSNEYVVLSNLSIYYTCKNIKSHTKKSVLTWIEELELPDGSYSVPDIQGFLKYVLKS